MTRRDRIILALFGLVVFAVAAVFAAIAGSTDELAFKIIACAASGLYAVLAYRALGEAITKK